MHRFIALALLLLAISGTSRLHAVASSMLVEVFAAGTLEKLQLAQGSYVEDYDQLNLRLNRVSTSWCWYDGDMSLTYDGYVVTSSATDYVPFTQHPVWTYNGTMTRVRHYLNRPIINVVITPSSFMTEGGSGTGTITLKNAAGANVVIWNNLTINLTSNSARATVPASVMIPANTSTATFTVNAVNNTVVDGTALLSINASAGTWGNVNTNVTVYDND